MLVLPADEGRSPAGISRGSNEQPFAAVQVAKPRKRAESAGRRCHGTGDGKGLYLLVKPSGSRSWVLRVQSQGERRDFGIGSVTLDQIAADIPIERKKLLTLAEAREKARIGRALAKAGLNPSEHWRQSGQ